MAKTKHPAEIKSGSSRAEKINVIKAIIAGKLPEKKIVFGKPTLLVQTKEGLVNPETGKIITRAEREKEAKPKITFK